MLAISTFRKLIPFRSYIHEIEAGCRFYLVARHCEVVWWSNFPLVFLLW
jgi:hypothetical protein